MNSAAEIVAAVRSGERTPSSLLAAAVDAIGSDTFNAYTRLVEPHGGGPPTGILAGVPIALKDLIDQTGQPTTCGSGFYSETPAASATVVDRLEEAGATIVGRTGLHEFAFGFSSENHWFGPVRNPWDPATSPGGSSGGSAVAVAAGHVPIAIGTDTGGSIRVPAALCGVFGLKVTHGRISLKGVFPLAPSIDTVGPLARTAADLRLAYDAMRGADEADPWSDFPPHDHRPRKALRVRIGVPTRWIAAAPLSEDVKTAFDAALDRLSDLGHDIVELDAPELAASSEVTPAAYAEVAAVHRTWFEEGKPYGPEVRDRLAEAMEVSVDRFVEVRAWRAALNRAARRAFDEVDFLVTPTVGAMRKVIGEDQITIDGRPYQYRAVLAFFTALINHVRAPALAMPLDAPGNPPPSIQLIGPRWSEDRLLRLAETLESSGLVRFRPPPR